MFKNIKVSEKNWDSLWKIKRKKKLKNMDKVISYLLKKKNAS